MSDETRGIALMLCAILLFSCMDVMAKAMSQTIDPVQAIWARYSGQTLIVAILIAPRAATVLRAKYPKLQFLRSVFLLGSTVSFFYALAYLELAEAAAIMSLNPVLITLGAALVLGEKLGIRRLTGIAVALIGALIIIRPGSAVFTPAALLPLCAALCYSAYALTTRFVGRDEDVWTSLFYTAVLGAVVTTLILPFYWRTPDPMTLAMMIVIGGFGAVSQMLLIRALSLAEASLIAPFAYCGLIFAVLWGFLLFDEVPDAMTLLGALVIAAAGLYVWHRERQPRVILPPHA